MHIHINYHMKEMDDIKDRIFKVSVQRIIETSGSFSGLTLEIKNILYHQYSIGDFEIEGKTLVLKKLDYDWYEIVGVQPS